ncbi:hypothetical protein LCGC14_2655800 [marine sediment metagenome]|uniref:Uncharacterized protein n=1 Tax=marine sediment metagenome TaxID=412755 RepID=A0A0F8ZTD6_9ZZZZ
MALYDYECSGGHATERRRPFLSVDEDPGVICLVCGRVADRLRTFYATPANWEWEMVAVGNEPDVPTRVGF